MSSPTTELLRALVDDAAVFPPGNSPLPDAVTAHAAHRAAAYGHAVGPLLVPASAAADLLGVLDTGRWDRDEPLDVALVSRPGADVAVLREATLRLGDDGRVDVCGAELGWYDGWSEDLAGELPLAVEAGRGADGQRAHEEVRSAHREGLPVVLKFRTGPTPTWPWPDEAELASFLRSAADEVPVKLTGGLHHAVRGTYLVDGEEQENHGLLNVLVATSAALDHGAQDEVAGLLGVRDARALADLVGAWTPDTARRVRQTFTAYGCCTVTDPLGELSALGIDP